MLNMNNALSMPSDISATIITPPSSHRYVTGTPTAKNGLPIRLKKPCIVVGMLKSMLPKAPNAPDVAKMFKGLDSPLVTALMLVLSFELANTPLLGYDEF